MGRVWRARWGWALAIGTLVVILVVTAAFTFSLIVSGPSMEPTLRTGDRLLIDPFTRGGAVRRFAVVQQRAGPQRIQVVKRVIGLPGDRVAIRAGAGSAPVKVFLSPAGDQRWFRVENTAWDPAAQIRGCCRLDGTAGGPTEIATVPPGRYFLLGDNLAHSDDSRTFGWAPTDSIGAGLGLRLAPLANAGPLPEVARLVPTADNPEAG